MSKYIELPH